MRLIIIFSLLYSNVLAINVDQCPERERRRIAAAKHETCKNGIYIDGVYHEKNLLITCLQRVYYPIIDFKSNTLFYSNAGENPSRDAIFTAHRTARLDLNTLQRQEIRGDNDAYCNTLDRENHIIYTASRNGIYAFNFVNGTRYEYYGAHGPITTVQFVNGFLYYTAKTNIVGSAGFVSDVVDKLYVFNESKNSVLVEDLKDSIVNKFVIDNDGDITFYNYSGIFIWKKSEGKAYRYLDFIRSVNSFNIDNYGIVYLCSEFGIYKLDKAALELKLYVRDGSSTRFSGLSFDKDNNIVYADGSSIVKLISREECVKPVDDESSWFNWDNIY